MIQKTHKISFHFYDIGGGDAIHIRFLGNDNQWHNILIDGGYGKEYKNAFGVLIKEINSSKEKIDYWVISHIDLDHIGAVKGFIKDSKIENKSEIVKNYLFNHSKATVKIPNGKIAVRDGIELRDFLIKNDIQTITPTTTKTKPIDIFGLKLTFLSPTPEKEAVAAELWRAEEKTKRIGRTTSQSDHNKTIEELKSISFQADTDPINGSSISILIEFGEIKALLLADSHPKDIIKSLDNLKYNKHRPLNVKFMQLAHHGSKANTCSDLLDVAKTKNYIVTGNGIHNRHPDKETIVRILFQSNRADKVLDINFVCDTKELRDLFKVDENAFENYKFNCTYGQLGPNSKVFAYLPIEN